MKKLFDLLFFFHGFAGLVDVQGLLYFKSLLLGFGPRVGARLVFARISHLEKGDG